jgi:hypothetical protein
MLEEVLCLGGRRGGGVMQEGEEGLRQAGGAGGSGRSLYYMLCLRC